MDGEVKRHSFSCANGMPLEKPELSVGVTLMLVAE